MNFQKSNTRHKHLPHPAAIHSDPDLKALRHSAPLLLASTVLKLFPNALLAGGGPTDIGFYYDFVLTQPLPSEVLELIEIELKSIAKQNREVRSLDMMRENSRQLFMHHEQPILAEEAIHQHNNILQLIQIGNCYDLSSPPHVNSTQELQFIKLLGTFQTEKVLSDQTILPVTRIIGTVFLDQQTLKTFLKKFEKQKKFDHQLLGPELDLFTLNEQGCYWHPKGEILRHLLLEIWEKGNLNENAQPVSTPDVVGSVLTQHIKLYKCTRSNAISESACFAESRLNHQAPIINQDGSEGLFYSNPTTTDQLTIFCKQEEILSKIISSLHFIEESLKMLGIESYRILRASKQDKWMSQALAETNLSYTSAAPASKSQSSMLKWRLVDSLGREWEGPSLTIHLLDAKVAVIGRVLYGSLDRIIAQLIEKSEGEFPFLFAPEQIRVIPIGSANFDYAKLIIKHCQELGFRVQWDNRDEKLSVKIHSAEKERIPYSIIIGEKERGRKSVTVRSRNYRQKDRTMPLDEFFRDLNILKGI